MSHTVLASLFYENYGKFSMKFWRKLVYMIGRFGNGEVVSTEYWRRDIQTASITVVCNCARPSCISCTFPFSNTSHPIINDTAALAVAIAAVAVAVLSLSTLLLHNFAIVSNPLTWSRERCVTWTELICLGPFSHKKRPICVGRILSIKWTVQCSCPARNTVNEAKYTRKRLGLQGRTPPYFTSWTLASRAVALHPLPSMAAATVFMQFSGYVGK